MLREFTFIVRKELRFDLTNDFLVTIDVLSFEDVNVDLLFLTLLLLLLLGLKSRLVNLLWCDVV